jgi:hypothetical protein
MNPDELVWRVVQGLDSVRGFRKSPSGRYVIAVRHEEMPKVAVCGFEGSPVRYADANSDYYAALEPLYDKG